MDLEIIRWVDLEQGKHQPLKENLHKEDQVHKLLIMEEVHKVDGREDNYQQRYNNKQIKTILQMVIMDKELL